MSKHWNPRDVAGGRRDFRRPNLWASPRAYVRGRPRASRQNYRAVAMMVAGGVTLGLLAAAGPQTFSGNPVSGPGDMVQPASVWVIDGDTFDVGGTRIRVADIDTPEVRGRCPEEIQLAARATARMRTLLQEGPFELRPIAFRDEDQYGRKLRVVTRGGRSLGDQLVTEGLARTWTGRREPWC